MHVRSDRFSRGVGVKIHGFVRCFLSIPLFFPVATLIIQSVCLCIKNMTSVVSHKRKIAPSVLSSSPDMSWEETKARLEAISSHIDETMNKSNSNTWLMQLQQSTILLDVNNHQLMDEPLQDLHESALQIRKSLQAQIDDERQALATESNDLFSIVQRCNELESVIAEQEDAIAHMVGETQVDLRAKIHTHKQITSQQMVEMDQVELQRMQQVPKIKNQISLYAKTTGIKWDYHFDHILAGQVVSTILVCHRCGGVVPTLLCALILLYYHSISPIL
jgi:hypothetical protein